MLKISIFLSINEYDLLDWRKYKKKKRKSQQHTIQDDDNHTMYKMKITTWINENMNYQNKILKWKNGCREVI